MQCGNFLILLMTSVYVIETTSQRATGSTGGYMTLKISCDHVQGPLDKCTIKVCDFELATFLEKEGGSQELRFTWSLRKCCVLDMLFVPDAPRTPRICGCIWRAPQWGGRNLVTAMSFRILSWQSESEHLRLTFGEETFPSWLQRCWRLHPTVPQPNG